MKKFIIGAVIFVGGMAGAQASTIYLKDGRAITGDIIQQDKNKVIMKSEGTTLTYYKDEIQSIKEDVAGKIGTGNSAPVDAAKEQLVQQYLNITPTESMVLDRVRDIVPEYLQGQFLSFLRQNSDIEKLTAIRKRGVTTYFSSQDLRTAINFYASPEGKSFHKSLRTYNTAVMPEFTKLIRKEARKDMVQMMKKFISKKNEDQTQKNSM